MFRPILSTLLLLTLAAPLASADTAARYDAVKSLGRLNGEALQCGHADEVRRMKQAVIDNAPKERSFGLAFDEATNEAFLDFINSGGTCSGKGAFSSRVDAAIEALREAFSNP